MQTYSSNQSMNVSASYSNPQYPQQQQYPQQYSQQYSQQYAQQYPQQQQQQQYGYAQQQYQYPQQQQYQQPYSQPAVAQVAPASPTQTTGASSPRRWSALSSDEKAFKILNYHKKVVNIIKPKCCCFPAAVVGYRSDGEKVRKIGTFTSCTLCCCCSRHSYYENVTCCKYKQVTVQEGCCTHDDFKIMSIGLVDIRSNKYCCKCGDYDCCCPCYTIQLNLLAMVTCLPCCIKCKADCVDGSGGFGGYCMSYDPHALYDEMCNALYDNDAPSQVAMV